VSRTFSCADLTAVAMFAKTPARPFPALVCDKSRADRSPVLTSFDAFEKFPDNRKVPGGGGRARGS